MRSNASEFDLIAPGSLDAVLSAMSEEALTPIAGGTELMVALGAGRLPKRRYVNLHGIGDLRFIDASDPAVLRIGSGTTFTDLRTSDVIEREFRMIARAASWTGSIANQNRGTIGGNIANASPAADTPPALLAYAAEIELISARGVRTLPYTAFHLGYKKTALAADELIYAVRLPRSEAYHRLYIRKVGTRNAQAISKVAIAAVARMKGSQVEMVRVGAASLGDRPMRLYAAEEAMLGERIDAALMKRVRDALAKEAAPIDDIRSTAKYRVAVAQNLLAMFARSLS